MFAVIRMDEQDFRDKIQAKFKAKVTEFYNSINHKIPKSILLEANDYSNGGEKFHSAGLFVFGVWHVHLPLRES